MTNEDYIDILESQIDLLKEKERLYEEVLTEQRKIRKVLKSQEGLKRYVDTVASNIDKRLYTTEELADMCNWELGTYKRKMTELLSREYYSRHLCEPPEDSKSRPVYPRYMLQIMQAHLERKFG